MDDKFCIEMKNLRPMISGAIDKEKICLTIVDRIAQDISTEFYTTKGLYGTPKPDDGLATTYRETA